MGLRSWNRMQEAADPTLEIRLPISPTDQDLRMLRYFLESLREFGGPIAQRAHCVCSVGADEPPRDLARENDWTSDFSLEFRWLDRQFFRRGKYDATGTHRFWIESAADVVAYMDVDLLCGGDFDSVIREAHGDQCMFGLIAHISPFALRRRSRTTGEEWWARVFQEAELEKPPLEWEHTGWGLRWGRIPWLSNIVSRDPNHRYCPPYFNCGVVIGPRQYGERMGETFEDDLASVGRVLHSEFNWQIAHCVSLVRHEIPCRALSINENFALNVSAKAMRALHPATEADSDDDIKIFHYIGGRRHFATPQSVEKLLRRVDLSEAWQTFQRRLRVVHRRIEPRAPIAN